MAQGKRTDLRVREYIAERAIKGQTARGILDELERSPLAPFAPGIRAVQSIAREYTTGDGSARWTLANAAAEELRAVLPVLRDLCEAGLTCQLTVREAELISTFRTYDPEIPAYAAWSLTRQVIARGHESTGTIEACLAYAPWRDGGLAYVRAFLAGRFPTLHYVCDFAPEAEALLTREEGIE